MGECLLPDRRKKFAKWQRMKTERFPMRTRQVKGILSFLLLLLRRVNQFWNNGFLSYLMSFYAGEERHSEDCCYQKVISYFFKTIHWKNVLLLPEKKCSIAFLGLRTYFLFFPCPNNEKLNCTPCGSHALPKSSPSGLFVVCPSYSAKDVSFSTHISPLEECPTKTGILGLVNKVSIWSEMFWPAQIL